MLRRKALKIVALGALLPKLDAFGSAEHCASRLSASGAAWAPREYKLQFFTGSENELLDKLMEMIIPADAHSPGAHAAEVSLFADLMVATGEEAAKKQWREGLHLMEQEAAKSSLAEALAKSAAHEGNATSDLERFFAALKQMTVNGYYTSAIGIHQDLQYVGNDFLPEFPGCTHPEHQA